MLPQLHEIINGYNPGQMEMEEPVILTGIVLSF